MPTQAMPAAEFSIDLPLVGRLLADQHPDLAGLPLCEIAHGWDNVMVRVGDAWTARLPRRELAVPLVRNEQRVLPQLAPRLPLAIPVPERIGAPACGYPWPWSLSRFLPGRIAAVAPPADPEAAAETLGAFLAALHQPAPLDAPENAVRGVPLSTRDEAMQARLVALGLPGSDAIRAQWDAAIALTPWSRPPVWLHGDLHPANLLVHEGRLAAVIDFGDVTSGDPATDLAVAWMLLPSTAHSRFRAAVGDVDEPTWARARGWALFFAITYLAHSRDNATMREIGQSTLARVLAD
jgi:aminoglycoside phosphotransferase (APT) family kinase protein